MDPRRKQSMKLPISTIKSFISIVKMYLQWLTAVTETATNIFLKKEQARVMLYNLKTQLHI